MNERNLYSIKWLITVILLIIILLILEAFFSCGSFQNGENNTSTATITETTTPTIINTLTLTPSITPTATLFPTLSPTPMIFQSTFIKFFGGSKPDYGSDVKQTGDDGFILSGTTETYGAGGTDIIVIKVDKFGKQQWFQTYGAQGDDYGVAIEQTIDGGYIFCGNAKNYKQQEENNNKILLFRIDYLGNVKWMKLIGEAGRNWAFDIHQTQDLGYLVAAQQTVDGMENNTSLIKFNHDGKIIWNQHYGKGAIRSISLMKDGCFIMAGDDGSHILVIKSDEKGNLIWKKTFSYGTATSIVPTNDSGFAFTGFSLNGLKTSMYIFKLSLDGSFEWSDLYDDETSWGSDIYETQNGDFLLCGYYENTNNQGNIFLSKVDFHGKLLWSKLILTKDNRTGGGKAVLETFDKGIALSGFSTKHNSKNADIVLIKTDFLGNVW